MKRLTYINRPTWIMPHNFIKSMKGVKISISDNVYGYVIHNSKINVIKNPRFLNFTDCDIKFKNFDGIEKLVLNKCSISVDKIIINMKKFVSNQGLINDIHIVDIDNLDIYCEYHDNITMLNYITSNTIKIKFLSL